MTPGAGRISGRAAICIVQFYEGRSFIMPNNLKSRRLVHRILGWGRPRGPRLVTDRARFAADAQEALDISGGERRAVLTLADLKPGQCADILMLQGATHTRLRLLEMGLTPGTHVRVVRVAAFGGPLDIRVRNYQLSLRREEAARIWIGVPGSADGMSEADPG